MSEKEKEFKCYMYHKEHGARLFESEESLENAGDGWKDSPAAFDDDSNDLDLSSFKKPELENYLKKELGVKPKEFKGFDETQLLELIESLDKGDED